MEKSIDNKLDDINNLIGDTPVSVQISTAIHHKAEKDHTHEEYAPRDEFEALKRIVDQLVNLVGDTSVAEQIDAAINKIR